MQWNLSHIKFVSKIHSFNLLNFANNKINNNYKLVLKSCSQTKYENISRMFMGAGGITFKQCHREFPFRNQKIPPRHHMKFPKIPVLHGVFQRAPNTAEMGHFDGRQVWWGKEKKGNAISYCKKFIVCGLSFEREFFCFYTGQFFPRHCIIDFPNTGITYNGGWCSATIPRWNSI